MQVQQAPAGGSRVYKWAILDRQNGNLGLTRSRGIRLVALTQDQLSAAAQLLATTSVKTPNTLQLVAGIGAGCQTFLTNDRRLPLVPGLEIRQLSAYVGRVF